MLSVISDCNRWCNGKPRSPVTRGLCCATSFNQSVGYDLKHFLCSSERFTYGRVPPRRVLLSKVVDARLSTCCPHPETSLPL